MNKIYRVVWNFAVMAWTVVSELGGGRLKRHPQKTAATSALLLWAGFIYAVIHRWRGLGFRHQRLY